MLSVQPGHRGNNDYFFGQQMATFNCFSVQGRGDSSTRPDPENRMGNQGTGNPGRSVSSVLQLSGVPGHCRARTRTPW